MKNYIIRIYRDKKGDHRDLVGAVEEVGRPGRRVFTNFDELRDILNSRTGKGQGDCKARHIEPQRAQKKCKSEILNKRASLWKSRLF